MNSSCMEESLVEILQNIFRFYRSHMGCNDSRSNARIDKKKAPLGDININTTNYLKL